MKKTANYFNTIIVGAGASGLLAACELSAYTDSILVIDRMDAPGKKILATGNGKCNITNLYMERNCFRGTAGDLAYHVSLSMTPELLREYFFRLGLLTMDRNGYVYPITEQAKTVLKTLLFRLEKKNIPIHLGEKVKNIKLEDILCLFVILCPIFDMLSFIFRNTVETTWSPSSFLRPILPLSIFAIVFFKNKIKTKMFVVSLAYGIYAAIHLYIFNLVKVEASYGGILSELQYLVNYTFMIMNLFLFTFLFWKKDGKKLQKSILVAFGIYTVSIYVAILTGTSSPTYIEECVICCLS